MTKSTEIVLKLGGELVTESSSRRNIAKAIARLAANGSLVVIHGGGPDIDAELAARGITKRAVDGLRVTDLATLDVVVSILAGRINTQLVAAARHAGVRAVGLTAADSNVASVQRAKPYTTTKGDVVDLGFVGQPTDTTKPELLHQLCNDGFVPVITSVGCDDSGQLLNVNADTLAGHLAVQLGATQLLMAGGTAGVLDQEGHTIPTLDRMLLQQLLADGRASAGMVAKLMACSEAARSGVARVEIIDGTETDDLNSSMGTRVDLHEPKT